MGQTVQLRTRQKEKPQGPGRRPAHSPPPEKDARSPSIREPGHPLSVRRHWGPSQIPPGPFGCLPATCRLFADGEDRVRLHRAPLGALPPSAACSQTLGTESAPFTPSRSSAPANRLFATAGDASPSKQTSHRAPVAVAWLLQAAAAHAPVTNCVPSKSEQTVGARTHPYWGLSPLVRSAQHTRKRLHPQQIRTNRKGADTPLSRSQSAGPQRTAHPKTPSPPANANRP